MDIKHLYDIPNYWGQRKEIQLPKYQYTMRDTKSGMLFLGFSDDLSELNARTMVDHFLNHLSKHLPFPMQELIIQTDNGVEFSGTARHFEKSAFSRLIHRYGARHVYIHPGMCNANADVESIPQSIEEEFYDLTKFSSRADFMKKAESYRLFYNGKRPNYSKNAKTPWLIVEEDWSNSNISIYSMAFHVLDLDKTNILSYHNEKGQSFPISPERFFHFWNKLFG